MQERVDFKMSPVGIQGIKIGSNEKEIIILNELLANKTKVEDLLIAYYFKSRGRVFNVKINRPVLENELKGFFYVNYSIGHFNACADVDSSEDERMKISIDIDLEEGGALLIGEFFPEREPDEF